jgi:hypothetical protein
VLTIKETISNDKAAATLHTPWDCRWSRFGKRTAGETFWMCTFPALRIPIGPSDCETCPYWDFLPPLEALALVAAAQDPAK